MVKRRPRGRTDIPSGFGLGSGEPEPAGYVFAVQGTQHVNYRRNDGPGGFQSLAQARGRGGMAEPPLAGGRERCGFFLGTSLINLR